MSGAEFLDVGHAYDVDADLRLPRLRRVPRVVGVLHAPEVELVATYFDTADLALAHDRISLRRTGDPDPGWHLTLPASRGGRTEIRRAGDDPAAAPPSDLLDLVRAYVREHPVGPVLTLRTRRSVHHLRGPEATTLVDLCDDRVTAESWSDGAAAETWREWHLEPVAGDVATLDGVGSLLTGAGAVRSAVPFTLARVLGPRLRTQDRPSAKRLRKGTAGDVWSAYVARQVVLLKRADLQFRAADPTGSHRMRVAARRLRSCLATYRDVLEPGAADRLCTELKWLGQVLSGARDAQVLTDRITELVEQQPPGLVRGPVLERLATETGTKLRRGRTAAVGELDGARYFRLLDDLDGLLAHPPYSPSARQLAEGLARALVEDLERVRKRRRRVAAAGSPTERDLALHDVRKSAKRLRYAAEVVRPTLGREARRLSRRAKAVQQVLGEHQDSVVCRAALADIGHRAHLDGECTFTWGRLHALEDARARSLERAYDDAVAALTSSPER